VFDDSHSFITRAFLRAEFDLDYRAHTAEHDEELLKRLRDWDGRFVSAKLRQKAPSPKLFS
jgi:hypothetical protein